MSGHALLAITAFASAGHLAVALMSPREPAATFDFGNQFFRVSRD